MSKKRSCDENVETPTTAKRVNIEHDARLWKLVTDHPNVFDAHIVTKLNGNDVKFFYDVNRESRAAIKRSGVRLPDAFEIGDFATKVLGINGLVLKLPKMVISSVSNTRCLLYTSPSPRDQRGSRMPSSA